MPLKRPEKTAPLAALSLLVATTLQALPTTAPLGLAVSGGSDSMAMLHLMAQAAARTGHDLRVVTVDHRLRPEAADEARFVAGVCAGLGLAHDRLTWDHGVITGNLMDRARQARYGLIADWAGARGVPRVALAHTADDQAETFVMGLARAAGLDGLSGMRPQFSRNGVQFVRPFLTQSRADLRGFLTRHHFGWVEDPTNQDATFTRIKARRALKALAPLGITADRLAASVQHLAQAQGVVRKAVATAAERVVSESCGALMVDRGPFGDLGPDLGRLVLIRCLMWLTGAEFPPRAAAIQRFQDAILQGRKATLAGCQVRRRDQLAVITREPRAVADAGGTTDLWDGRWRVSGPDRPDLAVRALGAAGLIARKDWRASGLTREVLVVTPALWRGGTLVAAPVLDLSGEWSATVGHSFNQFILSH